MELRPTNNFAPLRKPTEPVSAQPLVRQPQDQPSSLRQEPTESFSLTSSPSLQPPVELPKAEAPPLPSVDQHQESHHNVAVTLQHAGVTYSGSGNGPLLALEETIAEPSPASNGLTLQEILSGMAVPTPSTTAAMRGREDGYLALFPFKNDEAAIKTRAALNARYNDPTTSASSVTKTVDIYAQQRGVDLDKVPENLTGSLSSENLPQVKQAAQGVIDKLFLSEQASFNPEKHATVSQQTERFLDLVSQAASHEFTAGDAYKLVAGNLALVSYQDKAAAENMLGDHGVRHLLGHNIKACEQLADGLEQRGTPVGAMDRLVMHQAMIVHDLGYAMDSVRDPINSEGLKGQDAGHNVLAARYLRERSQDPDDPLAKLFAQGDLERMHRCVLFHDKDKDGGPGVNFRMGSTPSDEDRAINLETMTRVADNSHAFEDKLPELLYRKPQSLKAMRLMKTAGELGDETLLNSLKGELSEMVQSDPSLAKDDREALLQSVSSVNAKSYQFSVGRISGSKPTFDVTEDGKVELSVAESDIHQQTSALFGMQSYKQMEKFVKDCSGQKVSLNGQTQRIEGDDVCVIVRGAKVSGADEFNSELHQGLLEDRAFVKFATVDAQLSTWQSTLEQRQKLGEQGLEADLAEVKAKRRETLEAYRASDIAS